MEFDVSKMNLGNNTRQLKSEWSINLEQDTKVLWDQEFINNIRMELNGCFHCECFDKLKIYNCIGLFSHDVSYVMCDNCFK